MAHGVDIFKTASLVCRHQRVGSNTSCVNYLQRSRSEQAAHMPILCATMEANDRLSSIKIETA
jgi:hypothetical protein